MRVYLLLMLVALGVTVIMTPVVRRLAVSGNVLAPPRPRDVHTQPTPRLGGIAMTLGFVAAMLLGQAIPYLQPVYQTQAPWAVMGGAVGICLLGVVDDVWDLDWLTKLLGQILVAGVMALNGVQLVSFPIFGITIGSSRLSLVVTILAIVATVNAVNFVDGLDGLAAGVVGIGGVAFFAYSYLLTRLMGATSYATTASVVVIAMVGVCAGFLWFNFHPASIFMGDCGAMVLGLVLSSAGIIVTGQIDPLVLGSQQVLTGMLPIILPLAVVLVPLADLVITPLRRLIHGRSPVAADRTHLHDRLLERGHSHRGVVLIMYMWTALICAVAVALITVPVRIVLVVAAPATLVAVLMTVLQFPGGRRGPTVQVGEDDGIRAMREGQR